MVDMSLCLIETGERHISENVKLADCKVRLAIQDNTTRVRARGSLDSCAVSCAVSDGSRSLAKRAATAATKRRGKERCARGRLAVARQEGRRRIRAHAARSRASLSTSLRTEVALGLIEAAYEASCINLPLNRWITLDWERGGAGDGMFATSEFLRRVQAWCRSHDASTAYISVREAAPRNGQHAHILLHVPPRLARDFPKRQCAWLAQCGLAWSKGNVKGRPIGKSRSRAVGYAGAQATYRIGLMRVVNYVLKEVEPGGRDLLGVTRTGTGMPVTRKRAGTSENIAAAARSRSGRAGKICRVTDLGRLSGWF